MSFRPIIRLLPAFACLAIILWLAGIPSEVISNGPWSPFSQSPETLFLHIGNLTVPISLLKVGHFVGYAVLGALLLYGFGYLVHRPWQWALITVAMFAIADEIRQTFTPGRSAAWQDMLLDIGAAGFVIMIIVLAQRRKERGAINTKVQ